MKCNKQIQLRSIFWTSINGVPIQTLIDTRSTITAASLSTIQSICNNLTLTKADAAPAEVEVANGNTETAIDVVTLPITIGSNTYFHSVQIFNELPVPLLLGDDFLNAHQDTLSFNGSTAKLTLINSMNNNIEYINSSTREANFSELKKNNDPIVWRTLTSPSKVPPKTLQKVTITADSQLIDQMQYMVEVPNDEDDELFVALPQLATCDNGTLDVFITNPHNNETKELILTISATPVITDKEFTANQPEEKYKPYPLSQEQKKRLDELLAEYRDVLADKTDPLGTTDRVVHSIDTGDEKPIRQKPYRLSPSQKEALDKELDYLLEKGVVRASNSPWSSPVVMVPKPDGSIRVCIDYRKLNHITKKHAHPLPKTKEILDQLNGAKIFTTIDLLSGFYQIQMDEKDIQKTSFCTHRGLFEYLRIPMGLCNSPATFERLVEQVFALELYVFMLLYIDDLIIFSKNADDHLKHLQTVLQRLREKKTTSKVSQMPICYVPIDFSWTHR